MDYYSPFLGPEAIFLVDVPQGALMCMTLTLTFWPILARFMDYYSPFWGPEAIFLVDEPQGALTCMTLTLAVLADSGPWTTSHRFRVPGDFYGC